MQADEDAGAAAAMRGLKVNVQMTAGMVVHVCKQVAIPARGWVNRG